MTFSSTFSGVGCDPPPVIPGLVTEKVFRVAYNESATYRCPVNTYYARLMSEPFRLQVQCLEGETENDWRYVFDDGSDFDPARVNITCIPVKVCETNSTSRNISSDAAYVRKYIDCKLVNKLTHELQKIKTVERCGFLFHPDDPRRNT